MLNILEAQHLIKHGRQRYPILVGGWAQMSLTFVNCFSCSQTLNNHGKQLLLVRLFGRLECQATEREFNRRSKAERPYWTTAYQWQRRYCEFKSIPSFCLILTCLFVWCLTVEAMSKHAESGPELCYCNPCLTRIYMYFYHSIGKILVIYYLEFSYFISCFVVHIWHACQLYSYR